MSGPEAVFAGLAGEPGAAWLDGGRAGWSVLAWSPEEVVTAGDRLDVGRRLSQGSGGEAPFSGGCLGYIAYPDPRPTDEPALWLGRYPGGACHHPDHGWVFGGSPGFCADARRRVAAARPLPCPPAAGRRPTSTLDRATYLAAVARIQAWLADGDCYQINLTRAERASDLGDPWDAYRRLRASSDAAWGAFLRLGPDLAILSNSPEELLSADGDRVSSEPIKGTRPRDPDRDAALLAELEASPKERAELAMIVDLVRNDLGRIAAPGTVTVAPRTLRSHATIHHASQRVHATLRPGLDAWDALASLFPAGSITGAPKERAMQRIAALEPEPRGVYCGTIGYTSGPRARWSVAIRTAVQRGDAARWHVGGGIVAGADPAAEWDETVAKGRALRAALAG